uniref:WW domain-containing protein n=1 Tax=Globodera rostochiensis TaxID=31243 RepID=A0A914HIT8_GLORO
MLLDRCSSISSLSYFAILHKVNDATHKLIGKMHAFVMMLESLRVKSRTTFFPQSPRAVEWRHLSLTKNLNIMSSTLTYSCWTDPRVQKQHEREFIQRFSGSNFVYGVSRNNYDDLIKRVGDVFGSNDKIRNSFKVQDRLVNGVWVVRLVDNDGRVLLPLEDVFAETERAHMKGNHRPRTPLHTQLRVEFVYPTRLMVDFVVDRCPVCSEKKKRQETKVPEEPHVNPTTLRFTKDHGNYRHKKLHVPQDPITETVSVAVESTAARAFSMINNLIHASNPATSSTPHGSLLPPHCINSPIPILGRQPPSTAGPSSFMPSFLTSTPVDRKASEKSRLVPLNSTTFSPNLSLPIDGPNDTGISVESNFIRFLNNSNQSQSGHQYLSIIREEQATSLLSAKASTGISGKGVERQGDGGGSEQLSSKNVASAGRPFEPSLQSAFQAVHNALPIKQEADDSLDAFQDNSHLTDEDMKNPEIQHILSELGKERFGTWCIMTSRSDTKRTYYYNSQTGISQNEMPSIWEVETKKRLKELNKRVPPEKLASVENCHSVSTIENAKSKSNEAPKFGIEGPLTSDVSVTKPFNGTNDALELLFGNGEESQENSAKVTPPEKELGLGDFCDMFQDELAGEFEVLGQGTVTLTLADANTENAPAAMENINLSNIPFGENICGDDVPTEQQIPKQKECVGEVAPVAAVSVPSAAVSIPSSNSKQKEIAPLAAVSVPPSNSKQKEISPLAAVSVPSSNSKQKEIAPLAAVSVPPSNSKQKELHVRNEKRLVKTGQTKKSKKNSTGLTLPKAAQIFGKRPFQPKQTVKKKNEASKSERSEDDEVKRPPPLLVHKMPICRVMVDIMSKEMIQNLLPHFFKKSLDPENDFISSSKLESEGDFISSSKLESESVFISSSNISNRTPRSNRASARLSQHVKQEIFQCVKCTRTRTFVGEQSYHLHEVSRHRNCVSACAFVVEYMEKLPLVGLSGVCFSCLPCDQTFTCAEYWDHMRSKHNAQIGARHNRIAKLIADFKDGKIQKLDIKNEFLSDYEDDDDFMAKDKTWNGRDGEWKQLELGTKNRRKTMAKLSGKKRRVKTEAVEDEPKSVEAFDERVEGTSNGVIVDTEPCCSSSAFGVSSDAPIQYNESILKKSRKEM